MRALVQRVSNATVSVAGEVIGQIERGVVVLLGVTHGDTARNAEWLARKIATLRIFEDEDGRLNASLLDIDGSALVVSQFTLYADTCKGRRPSFVDAADPEVAEPLFGHFIDAVRSHGIRTATGAFGKHMMVQINNDGPVTIMLER
jgi:D-tyrosyl-tRNA(Tyr) deacylase